MQSYFLVTNDQLIMHSLYNVLTSIFYRNRSHTIIIIIHTFR